MKHIAILVALCAISSFTFAQKATGSFKDLVDAGRAKVEVDFSAASIHGMSESEFSVYEEDWYKDKPEIISMFVGGMQSSLHSRVALGEFPNANAVIKVEVLSISPKGNYVCDVVLLVDGNEMGRINNVYAEGGKIGTKLNLIKDGAEHTGKAVGRQIKKNLKK